MDSQNKLKNIEVGWSDNVVMVCTKCAESSERIKGELKDIAKSELGSSVRVITSSCLNMCPENKVAIVVASKTDNNIFTGFAVDPEISGRELFNSILKNK